MTVQNNNYPRLIHLYQRMFAGTATKAERDEYMRYMVEHGHLKKEQFERYKFNEDPVQNDVLKAAITIGGIILFAYVLDRLLLR